MAVAVDNWPHDLPANPIVRHEHMLTQLCGVIGATWSSRSSWTCGHGKRVELFFLVYRCFDDPDHQLRFINASAPWKMSPQPSAPPPTQPLAQSPSFMQLLGLSKLGRGCVGMNGFAVDAPRRTQQPRLNHALRLGNSLTSTMNVGRDQLLSVISFHRGAQRSTSLQSSATDAWFGCFIRRWNGCSTTSFHPKRQALSIRSLPAPATLRRLLSGDSEKQIANKLRAVRTPCIRMSKVSIETWVFPSRRGIALVVRAMIRCCRLLKITCGSLQIEDGNLGSGNRRTAHQKSNASTPLQS